MIGGSFVSRWWLQFGVEEDGWWNVGGWMDVNLVQTLTVVESELVHEAICTLEGVTQEGGPVGRWWMLRVASQTVRVVGMRAYDWKDSARMEEADANKIGWCTHYHTIKSLVDTECAMCVSVVRMDHHIQKINIYIYINHLHSIDGHTE